MGFHALRHCRRRPDTCCLCPESSAIVGGVLTYLFCLVQGYNINNFDTWYILGRAQKLGLEKSFCEGLGRVPDYVSKVRKFVTESRAHGRREKRDAVIPGVIQFDVFLPIKMGVEKHRSYKLNDIAAHYLQDKKEDVSHDQIPVLWKRDKGGRTHLGKYCLKDAFLPARLMFKLKLLLNTIQESRVTGVPIHRLVGSGQQIKVFVQILTACRSSKVLYLVPKPVAGEDNGGYQGATVVDPERGFYQVPIVTLDFSALYPSIMMAHNLCYTTLLSGEEKELIISGRHSHLRKDDIIITPEGHTFVKPSVQPGLLPRILEHLLAARKRAKRDMAAAKTEFERALYNALQLALKIVCNSVYGFTGVGKNAGYLGCFAICESVTGYGREMLELTKRVIHEKYPGSQVIYGDTDSVMVRFGDRTPDVATGIIVGKEAAALVNKYFIAPISLEFEKVFFPYLLINKKRYAGGYWTEKTTKETVKVVCKGLEVVRRDNCVLLTETMQEVLDHLLIYNDKGGAIRVVRRVIEDLKAHRVPLWKLVISKKYTKELEAYKAECAHLNVIRMIIASDPDRAPQLGDRIPYVVLCTKKKRLCDKTAPAQFVEEHSIPVDNKYYINNQLRKPLLRIFVPILGPDAERLLFGEGQYRRRVQWYPRNYGITRTFTVKRSPIHREMVRAACKLLAAARLMQMPGQVIGPRRRRPTGGEPATKRRKRVQGTLTGAAYKPPPKRVTRKKTRDRSRDRDIRSWFSR